MTHFFQFSSNVNTITELCLSVADGGDIDPCPLHRQPCEEPES